MKTKDFFYGAVIKLTREDSLADIERNLRLMKESGFDTAVVWPAIYWWEEKREGYPFNTGRALLKKADVVSNICNDVIGDICGIMSGGAGAGIVLNLALSDATQTLIATIAISSIISALTVGGKALCKRIALNNAQKIVSGVGRLLSIFSKNK